MLVDDPHFTLEVPDSYVRDPSSEPWGAFDQRAQRQVLVNKWMLNGEAPVDDAMRELQRVRHDVLEKMGGAQYATPVTMDDRGELRESTFLATGKDPLLTFCGLVTHKTGALGQRWIVSFTMHQYFVAGAGAPVVELFERDARAIFETLDPMPRRDVLLRAEAAASQHVDTTRVFPYLVPAGYLQSRDAAAPVPPSVGHDLFVVFAQDVDGAARLLFPEDLGELGGHDGVMKHAVENLRRALAAQKVSIRGFAGPGGGVAMLFGPEWLAASCLLLPDLHAFASAHLGAGPLCASVPHRDVMVVFRDEGEAQRREMQALIAKNEADFMRKPLTASLFSVTSDGARPLAS